MTNKCTLFNYLQGRLHRNLSVSIDLAQIPGKLDQTTFILHDFVPSVFQLLFETKNKTEKKQKYKQIHGTFLYNHTQKESKLILKSQIVYQRALL